jgi:hypothetical protein
MAQPLSIYPTILAQYRSLDSTKRDCFLTTGKVTRHSFQLDTLIE